MGEDNKTKRKTLTAEEKRARAEKLLAKKEAAMKKEAEQIAKLKKQLAAATDESLLEILRANEFTEPNELQAVLRAVEELDPMLIPKKKHEAEAAKKNEAAPAPAPQTSQN